MRTDYQTVTSDSRRFFIPIALPSFNTTPEKSTRAPDLIGYPIRRRRAPGSELCGKVGDDGVKRAA